MSTMTDSKRIIIPIPPSTFPTRIEVHHNGELNRSGGVQPGATEASIKLPAPAEECEIRVIPCDAQGKSVGRGHVYRDDTLVPEPPVYTDPPAEYPENTSDDECCGEPESCEGIIESSEIEFNAPASVEVTRSEVDETDDEDDFDEEDED